MSDEPSIPMDGPGVFAAHALKTNNIVMLEVRDILRDIKDLTRDVRDELILMRKARENGHGKEP